MQDHPGSPRNSGSLSPHRGGKTCIFSNRSAGHFTQIPNKLIKDRALIANPHAHTILTFLLSFTGDWEVSQRWIEGETGYKEAQVRQAMHLLLQLGYVRRFFPKVGGKYAGCNWEIYNTPLPEGERTPFTRKEKGQSPRCRFPELAAPSLAAPSLAEPQPFHKTIVHNTMLQNTPPSIHKPCGLGIFFSEEPTTPVDIPGFAEILYIDWCKRCGIGRPAPNRDSRTWEGIAANAIELHADPVELMDAMFIYVVDNHCASKETPRGPAPWPKNMESLKWASVAWNDRVDTFGNCEGSESELPGTMEWWMYRKMTDQDILRQIPEAEGKLPWEVPKVVELMKNPVLSFPEIIRCAYVKTAAMSARYGAVASDWLRCRRGVLRVMQLQGFTPPPQYKY